jgi:hypothetical protein
MPTVWIANQITYAQAAERLMERDPKLLAPARPRHAAMS